MIMDLRTTKRIFLTAKEAQGVTSRTLETYTTELSRFFEYAISKDIYNITEVTADLIRGFLNSLKEKKLRNITIRRYYKELNTLFLFLQRYYIKEVFDTKEKKYKFTGIQSKNKNGDWKYHNTYDTNRTSVIPGSAGDMTADILIKYINENKIDNID